MDTGIPKTMADFFKMDHECVNWDLLNDWAEERAFFLFDQKSLVHPELVLSFPTVDGDVETAARVGDTHFVFPDEEKKSNT